MTDLFYALFCYVCLSNMELRFGFLRATLCNLRYHLTNKLLTAPERRRILEAIIVFRFVHGIFTWDFHA